MVVPPRPQRGEDGPKLGAGDGVDAEGGLVEDDNLGRVDQHAGERELLLHAARERGRAPPLERRETRKAVEPIDPLLELTARHGEKVAEKSQVLLDREVLVEAEALGHVPDARTDVARLLVDAPSHESQLARIYGEKGDDAPHDGRLAAAVRADEAEDAAFPDVEADPADRLDGAVGLPQGAHLDGIHQKLTSTGIPIFKTPLGLGALIFTP